MDKKFQNYSVISTYTCEADDCQMIFNLLIRCLSKASEKRQDKYLLPRKEIKIMNLVRNNCARYIFIFDGLKFFIISILRTSLNILQ